MELIYSMRRKPLKCEPPHFECATDPELVLPICRVSCSNIIAFSSPTELLDVDGETWGGHVYVCDMDTPWDAHKVTSTTNPISTLEWDCEGKQLVIGTTVGELSVYTQKDFLLNGWTQLYSATFPGEHIIGAVFFNNGRRIVLNEVKLDGTIQEKIQIVRTTPTLKGFGGVPVSGVVAVSHSGLSLSVSGAGAAREGLRTVRRRMTSAAMVATPAGHIAVAAISGARVRCSHVTVTSPTAITVRTMPDVCLPNWSVPGQVAWCSPDGDSLLLAGDTLSVWTLTERAYGVHKLLQKGPVAGSTTPGGGQKPGSDCFNTLWWQSTSSWGAIDRPLAVTSVGGAHVAVCGGRAVCVVRGGRAVVTATLPSNKIEVPVKKIKYEPGTQTPAAESVLCSAGLSPLGAALVMVDTRAQLHVFKVPQRTDIPAHLSLAYNASQLEYAMVAGLDILDFCLSLPTAAAEPLYDRITESFQRQPPAFQQYYFNAWVSLRYTLLSHNPAHSASAWWLTALQTMSLTWASLHSIRPDERSEAALCAVLADPAFDNPAPLAALEARPEGCVEAGAARALLRRGAELGAAALGSGARGKYDLLSDSVGASLTRRVVAVGRVCGRASDVILRGLVRGTTHDVGDDTLAACAALTSRAGEGGTRRCVCAPHQATRPYRLEYGVEPDFLRYTPEPPPQIETSPTVTIDSIRYLHMGGAGSARRCGRCGARSLNVTSRGRPDGAYVGRCRCGGKWTLFSNT